MKKAIVLVLVGVLLLASMAGSYGLCSAEALGKPQAAHDEDDDAAHDEDDDAAHDEDDDAAHDEDDGAAHDEDDGEVDEEAEEAAEKAREREKEWATLQENVRERLRAIEALAKAGNLDEAIADAEKYAKENPGLEEAKELLEDLKEGKEEEQEQAQVEGMLKTAVANRLAAMEQLRAYLKEHADSEEALKALATLHEENGDDDEAVEALEKAVAFEPKNHNLYRNMQRLYAKMGEKSLKVFVNGKRPAFDQPPVIKDGRTLVPVRAVSEALGATVEWQAQTREVIISKGDTVIRLQLESRTALVNGKTLELDVPAESLNGRTVVPLRFVGEALKYQISYDGASGMVMVGEGQ
ncbi:MAG: tetratricopeptide repeat protein [Firmicutes bacterium]|nr:tetratricopeptide repeat protein [Bacillota bacterium]